MKKIFLIIGFIIFSILFITAIIELKGDLFKCLIACAAYRYLTKDLLKL